MEYKYAVPIIRVMDLFPSIFHLATSALQLTVSMPSGGRNGRQNQRQNQQQNQQPTGQRLPTVQEQSPALETPVPSQAEERLEERSAQPLPPPPPLPPKDPMPPSPFPSFQRSPESVTTTIPDGASSFVNQFNYPPEVAEANNMMMEMKNSLGTLEVQFLLI